MPARPLSELPPSSWSRNPEYRRDLDPLPFRVRALIGGETVADSRQALVAFELGHAPVYYFPAGDLRADCLRPTDHATHCPYKGDASYWSVVAGGRTVENAVWSYQDPYAEMAALGGLMGLYWDRFDAWYHDDTPADRPVEIAGRVNETNNFAKAYPALAAEWHRERNTRLQPYEFAADSNTLVGWKSADGTERQASVKDRVLEASAG